jgi:predicted metal-dependent phosphotriesterase family hydrolase
MDARGMTTRDWQDAEFDYGLEPGESFEPDDLDEPFDPSQPHVMTVLGPVDPGALSFTLVHEHVHNLRNPLNATDSDLILDDATKSLADLEVYFAAGGRSIVDMGPADYGRSIDDLRWIAQRSPVNVILTTGHHKDLIAAPWVGSSTSEEIAERSIAELIDGIEGTDIRAGVIKAGSSLDEITDVERRVLVAAGLTQARTGAAISTHTEDGTMALEQIEVMTSAGALANRIILGHMDSRLDDLPYLKSVLRTGVFISFDRFHNLKRAPDEERAVALFELANAGFLDQLLVSGDISRKSTHTGYGGSPGFEHLVDRVPLILMDAGFDAPSVRQLFVENPARALMIERPVT